MIRSFEPLSVADDSELRSEQRLRRLYWQDKLGMYVFVAVIALAGAGLALAAGFSVYYALFRDMPRHAFLPAFLSTVFFSLMCLWMAWMFAREIRLSPVRAYLKDPASCEFAKGVIEEAVYLSDGKRSGSRMLIKGSFGEGGIFYEEFAPGIWSDSVAERGEEGGLRPGDDRYFQKGRRARLPLPAWVVFRRDKPRLGALAGIPAGSLPKPVRK